MTRYIDARDAGKQFSVLINQIENEDLTVVITRRGLPIVRMQRSAPASDPTEVEARMNAQLVRTPRPAGPSEIAGASEDPKN